MDSGPPQLAITSLPDYATVQRDGAGQADLPVSGTYFHTSITPTAIEARFNGGSWITIDAAPANGAFSGTLSNQSEGQGDLEVRFVNATSITAISHYVGIGDIFAIAGQSNASGRGTNSQSYSHASLKACLFGNDYVWKELADPHDDNTSQKDSVSSDGIAAGSYWLPLATQIMADQGVPVAFVPCAKGRADIETDWQPGADHSNRATLYGSMNYRIAQVGGVKAVLYHGGEKDALAGTSEANVNTALDSFANAVNSDQSIGVMICKLQTCTDGRDVTNVNNAIGTAWGDNANVLQGPDLSSITVSVHLESDADLATAAWAWWTAMAVEFYP
jgi:hypothetical protein